MTKKPVIVLCLIFALFFSACEASKNQTIGTIGGGALGAALGATLGDSENRALWAVGGAVAGAWIGNELGQLLDERDKKEMTESTQRAAITGERQTWSNPDTNVSGTAEVVGEEKEKVDLDIAVQKDRVDKVPPLDMIGRPYLVNAKSNVRGGPSKDYKVLETIDAGTILDVIGKVQGKNWMMVGANQIGKGFMHGSLLTPVPSEEEPAKPADNNETLNTEAEQKPVAATRICRTVKQKIILDDGTEKVEELKACQGPNGWEVS